jgi:hypothetical protein
LAIVVLKMVFLSARLSRKQPSRLAVILWLSLSAIWGLALVTTFLQADTPVGVMRGTLIAVGLTALALVGAFFNRKRAVRIDQNDTSLGGC